MRLLLLCALFLALASAQCSLYFDDCHACLSDNECGWCGDYCTSKDSAFCDVKMAHDASQCPTPDAPIERAVEKKSSGQCASANCPDCLATPGCSWCVVRDANGGIVSFFCLATSSSFMCSDPYVATVGHTEHTVTTCPGNGSQSTTSLEQVFILIFSGVVKDKTLVASTISTSFDAFEGNNPSKHIDPVNVFVLALTLVQGTSLRQDQAAEEDLTKRAGSTNTRCEFKVHAPSTYGGGQLTCNVDVQNWLNSLALGVPIGNGLTPVAKSGNPSNGNNNGLSGGDIAGIIIACIIGAALIAAILLWIILLRRKSGSHPAPFRSPAAAFRP